MKIAPFLSITFAKINLFSILLQHPQLLLLHPSPLRFLAFDGAWSGSRKGMGKGRRERNNVGDGLSRNKEEDFLNTTRDNKRKSPSI